jgi:putative DNA primase/helicase
MLTLAPDVKAVWVAFHNVIEAELLSGHELHELRDVASKTADNAARLAALHHTFTGNIGPIDVEAMESTARVTYWHLTEAKRFLGELAMPAELVNPARLDAWLLDYCKRERNDKVATSQIQQYGPGSLRNKKVFTEALKELTELGRARLVKDGKKRLIQINPALLVTPL